MRHNRALSIFEVVVLLVLLILVIGLALPLFGNHGSARTRQNTIQVREIQAACELFAQSNNGWYPGIKNDGSKVIEPSDTSSFPSIQHPQNRDGATASTRLALLVINNYFSGDYLMSPAENTNAVWTTGKLSTNQFSYALLQIDAGSATTSQGRRELWASPSKSSRGTTPILCDKSVDQDPDMKTASLWVATASSALTRPNDWRGSVAWNDGHVSFEISAALSLTKYGKIENKNDNLFTSTDGSATTANAAMVYN